MTAIRQRTENVSQADNGWSLLEVAHEFKKSRVASYCSLIIQCTAGIRRERTAPIVRPPTKAIPRVQIAPAAGHGCKKAAVERHPYLGRKKAAIANHCEKVNDFGVTIQSQHFAVS